MNIHGVLYRSGAEEKIRKYLVDNNYVDTVIQLPQDLFFGTNIATCIIVLKKSKSNNDVLFINASDDFVRNSNKNKLSDENINSIVDLVKNRTSVENKSILINYEDIKQKEYDLSVNTYLKADKEIEEIDIKQVNNNIREIVKKQYELRLKIDKIVEELEEDYSE